MKVANIAVAAFVVSLTACVGEVETEEHKQGEANPVATPDQDPSKPPSQASSQGAAPANSLGCQAWGCGTNHNRRLVRV